MLCSRRCAITSNQYDPELSSIKEVLNMVAENLFTYLKKPLLRSNSGF